MPFTNHDIQHSLEGAFDIPFNVQSGFSGGEPWYIIGPHSQNKELFEVRLSFRNHIRLIMEFLPDTYSAAFINDMATASEEMKQTFARYADFIFESKRAKIGFIINHQSADPCDPLSWPSIWRQVSLKVIRSPITAESKAFIPGELVAEWGTLMIGMILSLVDIIAIEAPIEAKEEGTAHQITMNRYERNPVNRQLCLTANGYICHACGMDFRRIYGEIGNRFIHVHHIIPVSQMGGSYIINPITDLVPVCPNCHAMLHKRMPPYSIEELSVIIKNNCKSAILQLINQR